MKRLGILAALAAAMIASAVPATAGLTNGSFESNFSDWSVDGPSDIGDGSAFDGSKYAILGSSVLNTVTTKLQQSATAHSNTVTLSFWYKVDSDDDDDFVSDTLDAFIIDNTIERTVGFGPHLSNFDSELYDNTWRKVSINAITTEGHNLTVLFKAQTDDREPTRFFIDDVRLENYAQPPIAGSQPSQQQSVNIWANGHPFFIVGVSAITGQSAVTDVSTTDRNDAITVPPGDTIVSLVYDLTIANYTSMYLSSNLPY